MFSGAIFPIVLISLFILVGIHLLLYSKKRHRLIKNFANKHDLKSLPVENAKEMEELLDSSISLDGDYAVRSVMKIKDLVSGQGVTVFRCIELLKFGPGTDSTPHHQNRIASTFHIPADIDLFFSVTREGTVRSWYPQDYPVQEDPIFKKLSPVFNDLKPPREVTITLKRGVAFIYNNPLVTGGEKLEDLDYLFDLSIQIKRFLG